jgi:thiol-disulfide isomerase/thioredoxin
MTGRKALVFLLALGAFLVTWAASRYAMQMRGRDGAATDGTASADGFTPSAEPVTLRFYRNPSPVPSFTAVDLDGRSISTDSFRGKVVILNFWATWCGPCRAEIPDLVALQERYRDTLQVIGISQDEVAPAVVKRFAAEHKVNYPVLMTTAQIDKLFPGISALPTSYIVDRQSRLVQKHVGMLRAKTTEYETRHLAGLPVNATIEEIDQTVGLKLDETAQVMNIPGVDLANLSPAKRIDAIQKLNSQGCTCGCDLTVAKCRVDDPSCGVSLPLARQIIAQLSGAQ